MKSITIFAAITLAFISSPVSAKHYRSSAVDSNCNVTMPCEGVSYSTNAKRFIGIPFGTPVKSYQRVSENIVSHPHGCPSRAFCGCGAAVRVFGSPVRSLWLASNWYRFPRTQLAAGMVAVRRHHVFVVEQVLGNGMVIAYDANSGRHATRIHARSVAGYTIVNPRGSRA